MRHVVRMTVPDMENVRILAKLKEQDIQMPIVADIHFDYRMAVEAAYAGADKVRINPGNIGSQEKVQAVVQACRAKNIAIRVGVNSGSLGKEQAGKIRRSHPGGSVRKCPGKCPALGGLRL